jgi:peptidoglycan/xylan/chitin deacetylase (PgdA/CDA1 family)
MRSAAILTYHSLDTSGSVVSVAPRDFGDQMATLGHLGYRGITLREATVCREASGTWPDRCVVLTFDDGYANFHEVALPILTHHGFTATIFLVSRHMGGDNNWERPPALLGRRPMLSWGQVADLSAAGMEIGAHTKTHPDLARLSLQAAEDEILAGRTEIEEQVGRRVESFAYPYGSVSGMALRIVAREFTAACTTVLKRADCEPLHELPRIDMHYIRSGRAFERLLNGELDRYLAIRRWGRVMRQTLRSAARPHKTMTASAAGPCPD